jgi:hypothetical protein
VHYHADDGRGPARAATLDLKTLAAIAAPQAAAADAVALRGGRLWLYRIDGTTLHAEPAP